MSMKPRATNAKRSPSMMPLKRCGSRSNTVGPQNWSSIDSRHLVVGYQVALGRCDVIFDCVGGRPAQDVKVVSLVHRVTIPTGKVYGLLQLMGRRIDVRVKMLHPIRCGNAQGFELFYDLDVVG